MIITKFDKSKDAIIEPHMIAPKINGFPKIAVTCFSKKIVDKIVNTIGAEEISYLGSGNGPISVYKVKYNNTELAMYLSPIGAPASSMALEDMISMGIEKIVAIGSCGVLDVNIGESQIIIPTSAVRDEGTSYHYIEASDEIELNTECVESIENTIKDKGYTYMLGKTWTTDAPYRETRDKAAKRKDMGCVCVEMECSALASVAKFRDIKFATFFYAADNLGGTEWEPGGLINYDLSHREKLMLLAFECVINL